MHNFCSGVVLFLMSGFCQAQAASLVCREKTPVVQAIIQKHLTEVDKEDAIKVQGELENIDAQFKKIRDLYDSATVKTKNKLTVERTISKLVSDALEFVLSLDKDNMSEDFLRTSLMSNDGRGKKLMEAIVSFGFDRGFAADLLKEGGISISN